MSYVYRTLIVPAALVEDVRALVVALAGPPADGMLTVGLSATGTAPATHYISTGAIDAMFAAAVASPEGMHAACAAAGLGVSPAQCTAILSASHVVDLDSEEAAQTLLRLGLRPITEDTDQQPA